MLVRQRILIEFLYQAARPVSKLELVKWMFLLRKETRENFKTSFYDFVPYHYGPYSFCLAREIGSLIESGWIHEEERTWELVREPDDAVAGTKGTVREVRSLVGRFGDRPQDEVIDHVYNRYPEYTVNSRRAKLVTRKIADPQVFTAGYEGLQVDGFLNMLVQDGIHSLIDVRSNPIARRYGYHRGTLSKLCSLLGIQYTHVPALGIRSELRRSLQTQADYDHLFENYQRDTLVEQSQWVERVADSVSTEPSVLVCMESCPSRCHRSRLASEISKITSLPIVHLGINR